MSTKAYNSYIVKNMNSVVKLNKLHQKIQEDIRLLQYEAMIKSIVKKYVYAHDKYAVGNELDEVENEIVTSKDPLSLLIKKTISEYQKSELSHERSYYDFSCSIVYIPYGKHIVFRSFCEMFNDYFKNNYEDFHYQDSTDKPKKISKEDWEERRKFWDIIDKPMNKEGISSFLTKFPKEMHVFDSEWNDHEMYKNNMVRFEDRITLLAKEKRNDDYFAREYPNGIDSEKGKPFSMSAWMDYNETPEAKNVLEKYRKEFQPMLDPDILNKLLKQ